MSSQSACEVVDLKPGDEIELYVIASNEGWEWTPATVIDTDPLWVRWWDGETKGWPHENARIPRIRRKPEPEPAPRRPALAAVERYFGIRVWTTAPNPLSVWSAKVHGSYGGFCLRLEVTGATEDDALDRLERTIVAIQDNAR